MAYNPLSDDQMFGFRENLEFGNTRGLVGNIWEGARDEWLGIDDFGRVAKHLKSGSFLKAMKSLGAGVLELGGTALMFVPGGQGASAAIKGGTLAAKGGKSARVLSKGARAGMKGENFLFKFLRPLSIEEQAVQRAMLKSGARRKLFTAPEAGSNATKRVATEARNAVDTLSKKKQGDVKVKASSLINRLNDREMGKLPFGASRGGIVGSAVRGVGQLGMLPMAQGPLARRGAAKAAAGQPLTAADRLGRFASGKLSPLAFRTGIENQAFEGGVNLVNKVRPGTIGTEAEVAATTAAGLPLTGLEQLSDEELLQILQMLEQGGYG